MSNIMPHLSAARLSIFFNLAPFVLALIAARNQLSGLAALVSIVIMASMLAFWKSKRLPGILAANILLVIAFFLLDDWVLNFVESAAVSRARRDGGVLMSIYFYFIGSASFFFPFAALFMAAELFIEQRVKAAIALSLFFGLIAALVQMGFTATLIQDARDRYIFLGFQLVGCIAMAFFLYLKAYRVFRK